MLLSILLAVGFASIVSLVGGVILLKKHKGKFEEEQGLLISAFAAGALLATALLDLLPEAKGEISGVLVGIIVMFVLEKLLLWYHHHHAPHNQVKPAIWLITIGDSLHNFLDGVAIAAAFIVSPVLGLTTTMAVFLHEIPHELVDFGILLSHGLSKNKTLLLNFISALFAVLGALLTYYFSNLLTFSNSNLLAFTAGNFLYISLADLIPELNHCTPRKQNTTKQLFLFFGGIILIVIMQYL